MPEPTFAMTADDDLPRTIRREREARERQARERQAAAAPALEPVFATVKVAVTEPLHETLDVAESPLVWNVVYERPKPNG